MATIEKDVEDLKVGIAELRAIVRDIALAQLRSESEMRFFADELREFKDYVLTSQQNFEKQWAQLQQERTQERQDREQERQDREKERQDREKERQDREKERQDREKERQDREKDRQEWQKERRELNKKWGELANKMGTLVEDIVAPNIPRVAKELFGINEVEDFSVRRIVKHPSDKSRIKDFDALLIGKDAIILNETKSTTRQSYIEDFIAFIPTVFEYLPQYAGKKVIPIFSSLYIPENFVNFLTNNGIYAMAMGEDTMEILNFNDIPKLKS
jgi:Skp family chaperone for outer membrane proteins